MINIHLKRLKSWILSKDPDIYEKIIKSTAPSIRGYRDVKEAIALQLFGGAAKELEDETRLRGDS